MSQHARVAFSSLARTVQCPGSVTLCESVPPLPPTEQSLEGDAAHWVATQYVEGKNLVVGHRCPNGVLVDQDMIDGALMWRDEVGAYGLVEVPCQATRIHPTDCWGTPDFRRWDPIAATLRMKDYKYGHGFVEVYECWQLIGGACAALEELNLSALDMEHVMVDFAIVQPRSYHRDGPVRRWTVNARHLAAFINTAFNAAHAALGPDPKLRTGAHCEYCPARHACPALQAKALGHVEYAGLAEPLNLPPDALGRELAVIEGAIEMLEARRTGLRGEATSLIERGERVAGYGLERSTSRLRWLWDNETVAAFGAAMGVDLRKPTEVITPTQAIQRKLLSSELEASFSERPPGALKLVQTKDATKIFSGAVSK